jgi:predicted esterase
MDLYADLKRVYMERADRHYFFYNYGIQEGVVLDLLIFLHGLFPGDCEKLINTAVFRNMVTRLLSMGCLTIFPVGLKAVFASFPECIAWTPDPEKKNATYMRELVQTMRTTMMLRRVFLGGFSNGAFFAGDLLQKNSDPPLFDGYWLQGGGCPATIEASVERIRVPVVMEISEEDAWHYSNANRLSNHLVDLGWVIGENLRYSEIKGPHEIQLDQLEENIAFLQRERTGSCG